jgi:urease accessory protein UreE
MDATGTVLKDGDIIEFEHNGELITAMVLLVTPEAVIFDLNDGSMPRVAHHEDLPSYRIFDGASA